MRNTPMEFRARTKLTSCLVYLALVQLGGCTTFSSTFTRYQRPELFFPTTAILKQELEALAGATPAQHAAAPAGTLAAAPPAPPTPSAAVALPAALHVESPAMIPAKDQGIYTIVVSDVCSTGAPDLVLLNQPQALKEGLKREEQSQWYKAQIDAAKLGPFIGDLELVVRSCHAAALSNEDARDRQLIKRVRIPVGYQPVTTSFNIWSTDDVREEFGEEFALTFFVADVVFKNPNKQPLLIYSSSLRAELRFLAAKQDVEKVLGPTATTHPRLLKNVKWGGTPATEALDFKEHYRPLSYANILAIFTNQKESDPRQRTISSLKSAGEIAAGAAVFVTGADYGSAVALFTGVLVPELEKQLLWDVLLHVKNLEQHSLKEVEEVPANGELRRAVFFPQRAMPAFLPPFPMYIAEIRPGDSPVTAVVMEKQATISSISNGDAP